MPLKQQIYRIEDVLQGGGEISLLIDVPQELFAQEELPGGQRKHLKLITKVVDQVPAFDGDGFGILQLLVLFPGSSHLETVEQDLLPVDLILFVLLLLLLFRSHLFRGFVFRFQQLEERVGEQLLFEMLLKIHHRHVQHVHGLVEPWIDP
jgi:hypothetical protein